MGKTITTSLIPTFQNKIKQVISKLEKKQSTNGTNDRHENGLNPRNTIMQAYNSTYPKVAVQCSADTFVGNQNLVLRINICGEIRHLRLHANRSNNISKQ